MSWGFFFDNTRCTGCRTCEMACKDYHDLDASLTYRRVIDYEGGTWQRSAEGETVPHGVYAYHLSLACNHCTDPACMHVCPTGAMHKDERGLVWPDHRKCIGCGYCTMACPYHAPLIDQYAKKSVKCDGCRTRIDADLRPLCVEACPLRALDCGDVGELAARHPQTVRSIPPLPEEDATHPNLLIKPSEAAAWALESGGHIANREEIR
ncbi:4Fe-4S dicluster domain-containing protein [Gordonibacter sp.]|uniref:4Fe-4S dicluster domain-containing protein n=1 Tax=Gordonibacter sp. TaxID=1968902 RepID=UPI002FC8D91E